MHGLLSIKRAQREPDRAHRAGSRRQRRASQPAEAAGAGSFSSEPQFDSGGLGRRSESAPGRGARAVCGAGTRADAALSSDAPACDCACRAEPGLRKFVKTAVLGLIGFYQSSLSPAIPSSCRFYPTCSRYAYEAVSRWGVRRGLGLAFRRVLRCRPFGGYGWDPVPLENEERVASAVSDLLASRSAEKTNTPPARHDL